MASFRDVREVFKAMERRGVGEGMKPGRPKKQNRCAQCFNCIIVYRLKDNYKETLRTRFWPESNLINDRDVRKIYCHKRLWNRSYKTLSSVVYGTILKDFESCTAFEGEGGELPERLGKKL